MFDDFFSRIDRNRQEMDEEFRRLVEQQASVPVPNVGDRVVLSAYLLNRGHKWTRLDGVVVERADVSVRVRYATNGTENEEWIHPAIITDVIRSSPVEIE